MTDPTPTEAEQAAINAMNEVNTAWVIRGGSYGTGWMLAMLRAVPLDYCVQRAINERALVQDHVIAKHRRGRSTIKTLYRLASENETPQMHTSSCDSGPDHPGPCR